MSLENHLNSISTEDVEIVIKPWRNKRSHQQNKYYWGVPIKLIGEKLGYDDDETHEILKQKFLKIKVVRLGDGEEFIISKSTTDLKTVEFEDFLSKVRTWASVKLECMIPMPNEVDYE